VEGDRVYYEYWNEGSGQNKRLIQQADAKTFQKLSIDGGCNFEFAKDKNHLFIDGEPIKNIDPNTFKSIGNCIFRDKRAAYFFGSYNELYDCAIKGVNPDSIELIKYPWARCGDLLIHGKDTVYLDDISEFTPLDNDWGKTKRHIINNNEILYGADVATFEILSSFQGKDKNYNFEFGIISENEFKKTSYRTFDFDQKDPCEYGPIVFTDIYDSLVSYREDEHEKIKIVEKLRSKGFLVNNIRYSIWAGESKIITVSMTNDQCNCVAEKLYRYDYSKPSETKKIFKVTERIHCVPKGKQNNITIGIRIEGGPLHY